MFSEMSSFSCSYIRAEHYLVTHNPLLTHIEYLHLSICVTKSVHNAAELPSMNWTHTETPRSLTVTVTCSCVRAEHAHANIRLPPWHLLNCLPIITNTFFFKVNKWDQEEQNFTCFVKEKALEYNKVIHLCRVENRNITWQSTRGSWK